MLEVYAKSKSKDIPKELEEYITYVARTGNPVFQWSHVKVLLKEKLLTVLSDFYEENPSLDIPPCPNVDPFDYECMKDHLINRLELFTYPPFTIQRICELLSTPRKEYIRIDKYMRAIEKNILVVTSRDSMLRKSSEADNCGDAIMNGMFYTKVNNFSPNHIYCSEDSDMDEKASNATDPVQGILNEWGENNDYKIDEDSDSSMSVNFTGELSFEVKEDKTEELDDKVNQCEVNVTGDIDCCSFMQDNELISQPETEELITSNDNSHGKLETYTICKNASNDSDKTETFDDKLIKSVPSEEDIMDELIYKKPQSSAESANENNGLLYTNACTESESTITTKNDSEQDFVVIDFVADEETRTNRLDKIESSKGEENLSVSSANTEECERNVSVDLCNINEQTEELVDVSNDKLIDLELEMKNEQPKNDECMNETLHDPLNMSPEKKESLDKVDVLLDDKDGDVPDSTVLNDVSSTSFDAVSESKELSATKDDVAEGKGETVIKVDADSTENVEEPVVIAEKNTDVDFDDTTQQEVASETLFPESDINTQ